MNHYDYAEYDSDGQEVGRRLALALLSFGKTSVLFSLSLSRWEEGSKRYYKWDPINLASEQTLRLALIV